MKQIILITDGCSNVGMNPVAAAALAKAEGIVVNVIGVVDHGEIGTLGAEEIEEIASAGGGLSRIVHSGQLAHTVQMMTRKTVVHTIQQAVGRELRQIMGTDAIEELPPDKRAQVVAVMDEMAETAELRVALLIDTSASMKPKLAAVEEAIRDLLLSLQAREGKSEITVFHFPGAAGEEAVMDAPWTDGLDKLRRLFYKLSMRGTTPTGPALMRVIRYISTGDMEERAIGPDMDRPAIKVEQLPASGDGILVDYLV